MTAGLFGKLPAKRDFIGTNASRRFLEVWEPWLQAGVATSKQMLGAGWIETYNRAPIWRYLARRGLLRRGDDRRVHALGRRRRPRRFRSPFSSAKATRRLPPPELEPNDAWFEAAEAILLDALEPGATLELIAEKVWRCPRRRFSLGQPRTTAWKNWPTAPSSPATSASEVSAAFLAARRFGRRRAFASQTFWWTIGGEGFPSLALSEVGLPPATRFADMLTGAFSDGNAVALGDAT